MEGDKVGGRVSLRCVADKATEHNVAEFSKIPTTSTLPCVASARPAISLVVCLYGIDYYMRELGLGTVST